MGKLLSGKLTSKGQLTIPVELRNYLNIEEGDRLEFVIDESGNLSVTPRKKKSIKETVGILKPLQTIDFETAKQIVQEARGQAFLEKDND